MSHYTCLCIEDTGTSTQKSVQCCLSLYKTHFTQSLLLTSEHMMQQYMIHRACGISEPRGRRQRNLKHRWTIMISGSMWSHFTSEETWDSENKIIRGHLARGWQAVTQFSESSVLFCSFTSCWSPRAVTVKILSTYEASYHLNPLPIKPSGIGMLRLDF